MEIIVATNFNGNLVTFQSLRQLLRLMVLAKNIRTVEEMICWNVYERLKACQA